MERKNKIEIQAFLVSDMSPKGRNVDENTWKFAMDMLDKYIEWNKNPIEKANCYNIVFPYEHFKET